MCKSLPFHDSFCLTVWVTPNTYIVSVPFFFCRFLIVDLFTCLIFQFLALIECSWVASYVRQLRRIIIVLDELALVVGLVCKLHRLNGFIHGLLWWRDMGYEGCFWPDCQRVLQESCQFGLPEARVKLTRIDVFWKCLNHLTKSIEWFVDFLYICRFGLLFIRRS